MNRKQFRTLLALNLVLLVLLAVVSLASGAGAQRGASAQQGAGRARGLYTMVAGNVQGMEESAIYIVDTNNQEVIAMHWDQGQRVLATIGQRNMANDIKTKIGNSR